MLKTAELTQDYAPALAEWSESDGSAAWDTAAGDGITR